MLKKMNEQEKRQANGGSVAKLTITGAVNIAWNICQAIVNRRK